MNKKNIIKNIIKHIIIVSTFLALNTTNIQSDGFINLFKAGEKFLSPTQIKAK